MDGNFGRLGRHGNDWLWIVSNVASHSGALFNGFAAGAVVMVLSTSLIPEGYEKAQRIAGWMVAIGFALEHAG